MNYIDFYKFFYYKIIHGYESIPDFSHSFPYRIERQSDSANFFNQISKMADVVSALAVSGQRTTGQSVRTQNGKMTLYTTEII